MARASGWAAAAAWVLAALILTSAARAQDDSPAPDIERMLLDQISDNPGDAEARFQLGWLYFERRRDRAAEFQLRQALADQLAPGSAEKARELLAALQRRRHWILTSNFAIAPSTSDRVVAIDGETLEDRSGVGLFATASVENRAPLGASLRWSTQVSGRALEFQGAQFDDMTLSALTGPLWLLQGDSFWSARAIVQRRWLGGDVEFDAAGAELATRRSLSDRVRVFARVTVRDFDYATDDGRDGLNTSADADITRFGPSGRFERLFGTVFRADAEEESQQFWFARMGVGGYRETGFGLGVYLEPSASVQDFDATDPVAGIARRDIEVRGRARIVKRDWRVFSAAPYVELSARRVFSTVDGLDRTGEGVEFGFTRSF